MGGLSAPSESIGSKPKPIIKVAGESFLLPMVSIDGLGLRRGVAVGSGGLAIGKTSPAKIECREP